MSLASLTATHRVTGERSRTKQDYSGGVVKDSWFTLTDYVNVPVTIQPLAAQVRYLFAQRNVTVTHRIFSAVDLRGLRKDDRLKDLATGRYYEIVIPFDEGGRGGRVSSVEVKELPP